MQLNDAIALAQQFLAKQERSESSLFDYLINKGCSSDTAQSVLETAKENSWVSDERFCLRYCEQQLCKGYGPILITENLRDKGLSTAAIIKAVSSIEHSTWEQAAILALEKKFGRDFNNSSRISLVQYLERRGFNDDYMMFLVKDHL